VNVRIKTATAKTHLVRTREHVPQEPNEDSIDKDDSNEKENHDTGPAKHIRHSLLFARHPFKALRLETREGRKGNWIPESKHIL
jgi:hypothetical protein